MKKKNEFLLRLAPPVNCMRPSDAEKAEGNSKIERSEKYLMEFFKKYNCSLPTTLN